MRNLTQKDLKRLESAVERRLQEGDLPDDLVEVLQSLPAAATAIRDITRGLSTLRQQLRPSDERQRDLREALASILAALEGYQNGVRDWAPHLSPQKKPTTRTRRTRKKARGGDTMPSPAMRNEPVGTFPLH